MLWKHRWQVLKRGHCWSLLWRKNKMTKMLLRVRSGERRNELIPVWDFKTGVKTSSVHMKFHFSCISKRPDILMDMCSRHFISGNVYTIFYHPKWNFISVKMTDMKSIPALSFKRTCALKATSNESALIIHFVSGKLCSHESLMPVWNFISVKMTNLKSIAFWLSFRLNSCERK